MKKFILGIILVLLIIQPVFSKNNLNRATAASNESVFIQNKSELFKLFVAGDFDELQKHFADRVYLMKGCELLKPMWGVVDKKKDKDERYKINAQYVSKNRLVVGLNTMKKLISKKGKSWNEIMLRVLKIENSEEIIANSDNYSFFIKKFNHSMKIKHSKKDDKMILFYTTDEPIIFIIRNNKVIMFYFD